MQKTHIVVGANYGDEGKGLASRYFALQAKQNKHSCLNVLYNGGAQRGHTVEVPHQNRFVAHHFGAGLYDEALTYCDKDFILAPAALLYDIEHCGSSNHQQIIIHPDCRVSTFYDALVNRIVEDSRGDKKHGSVGVGIWETTQRYLNSPSLTVSEIANLTDGEMSQYFKDIATIYVPRRLSAYGINNIKEDVKNLLSNERMCDDMVEQFRLFMKYCTFARFETLDYDSVVFEAGQGLALSDTNKEAYPHVTASDTGSKIPLLSVKDKCDNIEIDYVTRSYFTRHGAGPFPTECDKNLISTDFIDETNQPGEYQGALRYGLFDKNAFLSRVQRDMVIAKSIAPTVRTALFVTHMNYYQGIPLDELSEYFDNVYLSETPFAEDVRQIK